MIAISSHKPGCNWHRYARLTWEGAFSHIIYFGPPEFTLSGPRVAFVDCEPFPKIRTLVECCACQPGWSALINADIQIGARFASILEYLASSTTQAAVSARWQFNGDHKFAVEGVVDDMGLDIFIARQTVWRAVAREIPEVFRIGHILWDTWLMGFLLVHCPGQIYDFTPWKCVFHPRHERSKRSVVVEYRDRYIAAARWPIP